ncbi:hypothetical protein MHU86_14194 [Fragilaria crotonensis]|nr:hypothetical protein MHU86_14194 [Fragilaria crotonensis]
MNFLVLVTGPGNTLEVTILHRFMRYLDMPGEQASGFHDQVLGLQGDIMPHQYPAVEVPNSVFHLVQAPVRVPTVAAMAVLMPTWEDPSVPLGPFTDADPETEVVRPRNVQLLPGHYASLIIHRRRMSARWYIKSSMVVCSPETRSRHALTSSFGLGQRVQQGGGGAQNGSPCVHYPLTAVHLPEQVYRYLIGKERGTAPEERATVKEPKLLQDVYRETYRTLCGFATCRARRRRTFGDDWRTARKRATHTSHAGVPSCLPGQRAGHCPVHPIITTGLKQMIIGFMFVGHGVDDLSSGCQPFMVAYSGTANHLEALAVSSVSNQLAQGDQAASLHDYTAIKEKEVEVSRDTMDVAITLTLRGALPSTVPRSRCHTPFVERIWQLVAAINNATPYITDRFQQVAEIQTSQTGHHRSRAARVSLVGYGAQAWYLPLGQLGATSLEYMATSRAGNSGSGGRVSTSVPGSASTVSTGVSTLTAGTARASQPEPHATRVQNPTHDAEFTGIAVRPGGTRPAIRAHRPPANDAGHEFCLAWWLRGACFDNCGRAQTHANFASAAERTRLLAYCREHVAAPSASNTSA